MVGMDESAASIKWQTIMGLYLRLLIAGLRRDLITVTVVIKFLQGREINLSLIDNKYKRQKDGGIRTS